MYYRIQNAAAPDDPVFALVILAALTAPLHGNLIPPPSLCCRIMFISKKQNSNN